MIIAVTGPSGSIGRELIPFLESLGHNVLKVSSSIVSDGELNFSFDQLKNKSISKYPHFENIFNQLYYDFKLSQSISPKDVLKKTQSLRSAHTINTTQDELNFFLDLQ